MKKRFISSVFALAVMLSPAAASGIGSVGTSDISISASAAEAAVSEYDYLVLDDGTIEILKYNGKAATLTVPTKIDGYKVSSIGAEAFWVNKALTSVTIPSGIKNIGRRAFASCSKLTTVSIPASVTTIGDYAFYDCTKLSSVNIPHQLTAVGDFTFYNCRSIKSAVIPNTVTKIGKYAFNECASLKTVTIGHGVKSIGSNVFSKENSVNKIYCYPGTAGEKFAKNGGYDYELLKKLDTPAVTSKNVLSGVLVSWTKVSGAEGYIVYRRTSSTSWESTGTITNGNTSSYTDKTAKAGTTYYYTVKAVSGISKSDFESSPAIVCLKTPTVKASNALTAVNVSWDKAAGADGYIVYRKTGSEDWKRLTTIKEGNTVSYKDTTAKAGTTYSYTVRATSGSIQSDFTSSNAIKCLKAPTVTAKNVLSGVMVSWTKPTGAGGYIVYRKTASTDWERIAEISNASKLAYTDKTAKAGTTYYYTVKAVSGSSKSDFTSSSAIKCLKAPTVKASNALTAVNVSWNKAAGADGYIVYRKTGSENWSKLTTIKGGSTVSYKDTTAKAGTTYYYTVRATAGSIQSDFTSSPAIKCLKAPAVTAKNTASGVSISWTKPTGAGGYILYRRTSSSTWERLAEISDANKLTFTDKTTKAGVTYYYTVRATSGSHVSDFTSSNAVTILTTPKVTAAKVSGGIKVSWTKCSGADTYIIFRRTAPFAWENIAVVKGGSTVSYTDKTTKSGKSYYYTVKAVANGVSSGFESSSAVKA